MCFGANYMRHLPPSHFTVYLCRGRDKKHLLDKSKAHEVIDIKLRWPSLICPKCAKHSEKECNFYCNDCHIPLCRQCSITGKHKKHKQVEILKSFEIKKNAVIKDFQELKEDIYRKYETAAFNIPLKKLN